MLQNNDHGKNAINHPCFSLTHLNPANVAFIILIHRSSYFSTSIHVKNLVFRDSAEISGFVSKILTIQYVYKSGKLKIIGCHVEINLKIIMVFPQNMKPFTPEFGYFDLWYSKGAA